MYSVDDEKTIIELFDEDFETVYDRLRSYKENAKNHDGTGYDV